MSAVFRCLCQGGVDRQGPERLGAPRAAAIDHIIDLGCAMLPRQRHRSGLGMLKFSRLQISPLEHRPRASSGSDTRPLRLNSGVSYSSWARNGIAVCHGRVVGHSAPPFSFAVCHCVLVQ